MINVRYSNHSYFYYSIRAGGRYRNWTPGSLSFPGNLNKRIVLFSICTPIKNLPDKLVVPSTGPSSEIYQQLSASTGTSIHRIRVTKGSNGQLVPNDKNVPIQDNGLMDGSRVTVKDLGTYCHAPGVAVIDSA